MLTKVLQDTHRKAGTHHKLGMELHPFFCYLSKDHNSAEVWVGEKERKMEMVKIKSELLRDNTKLHWVPTGLPGQATTHCRTRNLQQPYAIPQAWAYALFLSCFTVTIISKVQACLDAWHFNWLSADKQLHPYTCTSRPFRENSEPGLLRVLLVFQNLKYWVSVSP